MRFAIVASALFAGLVAAEPAMTQTIHSTAVETITSCGPEVTNCPARSTSTAATATAAISTDASCPTVEPVTVTVTVSECHSGRTTSTSVITSAPYGMMNSTMHGKGTAASTGFPTTTTRPFYTGAANNVNAGMVFAGVAGFAALLV